MVATSAPITLWSPSSILFNSNDSSISGPEFADLVRDGYIRVLGREKWLTDRSWRIAYAEEKWDGAAWSESIDGRLKAILEEDLSRPESDRRVRSASEATGAKWASQLKLTQRRIQRIHDAFDSPTLRLPPGVKQAAMRSGGDPDSIARAVLTDAYNHAHAFTDSTARTPFFLDDPKSLFLAELVKILDKDGTQTASVPSPVLSRAERKEQAAIRRELARQLLSLLRGLEAPNRQPNLTQFLRGSGHSDLVVWYSRLSDTLEARGAAGKLDLAVLEALRRDFADDSFTPALTEVLSDPVTFALGAGGLVTGITSTIVDRGGTLNLAGLGITTISGGLASLRALHWIPDRFKGSQWPYLYTFGRGATRRRRSRMLRLLDDLARAES
jgi:hypothetical protein